MELRIVCDWDRPGIYDLARAVSRVGLARVRIHLHQHGVIHVRAERILHGILAEDSLSG